MTRIMRDSTTATDIPVQGTELVAGYINGIYAWTEEGYGRFPGIPHILMDIHGDSPHAGVLDVEPKCAPLDAAPSWVKARHKLLPDAYPPVIYVNRSTLTPLFNVLEADGLHVVRDFRLWIATLDGTRKVADMTGVTAVQYKRARNQKDGHWTEEPGPAVTEGHFDESLVYDDEWHHHA